MKEKEEDEEAEEDPPSLVAKNVNKKTFEIFFSSIHASLKLL